MNCGFTNSPWMASSVQVNATGCALDRCRSDEFVLVCGDTARSCTARCVRFVDCDAELLLGLTQFVQERGHVGALEPLPSPLRWMFEVGRDRKTPVFAAHFSAARFRALRSEA